LLAEVCAAVPPGVRGAHDWGMPDASGFAALACNEMLIHTSDIAAGLCAKIDPRREVCARVLAASVSLGTRRQRAVGGPPTGERPDTDGGIPAPAPELGRSPRSAR
jgi:hypothetical protein